MLKVEPTNSSPDSPYHTPTLADLSRNASVISTSSSDSGPSLTALTPTRPRPHRTFSAPRAPSRDVDSPRTRPPSHLARELGLKEDTSPSPAERRKRSKSRNRSVQDFKFGAILGEGSYSTVHLATDISTGHRYAIKVLDKGHLVKHGKTQTAIAEKNVLVRLGAGHPGIVRLYWTFHDDYSLYFVIDLATNGEMQTRISRMGSLSTECTQYYAAQIVDALDYMHQKGVIHRDLKPENLLLDADFRIKITDFGTSKILGPGTERAETFVGTAQYVSPELLENNETSKSSDFWALGCIIYQMIAGRFAFQGLSEYLTWQKIKHLEYSFPDGFDEQAKDLVQRLLMRDPLSRLGVGPPGSPNDMQALRSHPFFSSINWETLWTSPAPPLETGLVKKEHPLAAGHDQNWEDVGAEWDSLVEGEQDSDSLEWSHDAEGPEYQFIRQTGYGHGLHVEEVGPMGEVPRYPQHAGVGVNLKGKRNEDGEEDDEPALEDHDHDHDHDHEDASTILGHHDLPPPSPVKRHPETTVLQSSTYTGSASSSSEGSTGDKLDAKMESLNLRDKTSTPGPNSVSAQSAAADAEAEVERGRNRALSPLQGNGPSNNSDWSHLLLPGETVLFSSIVESRKPRRRASRLLPMATPPKPKTRQLVLTTNRLICLKIRPKGGVSIKSELGLRAGDKDKDKPAREREREKEMRCVLSSVEPKGEMEFVVFTSAKSQNYAAADATLASTWIQQINRAVEGHSSHPNLNSNSRT